MKNMHPSQSTESLSTIDTATLGGVHGGIIGELISSATSIWDAGHRKGEQKNDGKGGESFKDLVNPKNKANYAGYIPVVGPFVAAGRILYKAGESAGRR